MDRPCKWTKIKTLLLLLITIHQVLSDNTRTGPSPVQTVYPKEIPQTNGNIASPTPQLLNTLLTIAAANGVLPDLLPKIQPLGITAPETLAITQEAPRTLTVPLKQQPTQLYQQESAHTAKQQMVATSNANNVIPSQSHTTQTGLKNSVPVQPLIISPGLKQTAQQNNPFIPQISEPVKTQPSNALTNSKEETKTSSTPSEQPAPNIPDQITERLNPTPMSTSSLLNTQNGQNHPVNLQITVPPPIIEAPNIIFINTPCPTQPVESSSSKVDNQYSYPNWYGYGYTAPALPQEIIVRKKKSWLKDLLPFVLFSMINDDKHSKNGGCCCCNSRRRNTPVPYPIPIPTNNPIINMGRSSRKRSNKSDDDDDDDWLV